MSSTSYPYGLTQGGVNRSVRTNNSYDRLGRIEYINVDYGYSAPSQPLARYEYYPTTLGNDAIAIDYTYHISGAVKTAVATNLAANSKLFSESLYYEDCGSNGCTPQYNGNISRVVQSLAHGNANYKEARDVMYAYDFMNRLTGVDDLEQDEFDEYFAYDAQGRITSQRRGANARNGWGGEYSYYAKTNKLEKVANGMGGSADKRYMGSSGNFVYDSEGNLTVDKFKKLKISYDWRGMPVEFLHETGDNSKDYKLLMAYDESGARVWYSYNDFTGAKGFTEVTIPGVGVYHAEKTGGVDGKFALRRMDLVAGGFRDDGGVARFPMTDAQGNVRGYATAQGIQGAYDYYPYGTVVDLQVDGGADDKRWQGKEYDGEHGKYYFGARYFDPFFALWMSPDPAGQFSNPYTYGGDPLNYVDPNGEEIASAIIVGAIVGAAIGGGTSYYQCSQYSTNGNCGVATAKGVGIGAVAGAAGGAAGGAASGLSTAATGATGLASGSGVLAAMAGGAVEGAVAGAASGATSYTMTYLLGTTDDWELGGWFSSMLTGAVGGGLMGGATSAIRYGLSDSYQWQTYETVYDYGMAHGRETDVLQYIAKREGIDDIANLALTKQEYVMDQNGALGEGGSLYDKELNKTNITIAKSGRNTAANFYETVAHEGYHARFNILSDEEKNLMFKSLNASRAADGLAAEEALVRDRLLSHKFSEEYWGTQRSIQIKQIKGYLNGPSHEQVKSTLDLYGKNHYLYY